MTADLHKYMKSHLPLRERIRQALIDQRANWHAAQSLAAASPESLREYSAAISRLTFQTQNRTQYASHLASLKEPKPINYLALASLGNQIEDCEERLQACQSAIYGVGPSQPTEEEVDAVCEAYCLERIQQEGGPVSVQVIETATSRDCGEWIVSRDLLEKYRTDKARFLFKDGISAPASKLFDRGQPARLNSELAARSLTPDTLVRLEIEVTVPREGVIQRKIGKQSSHWRALIHGKESGWFDSRQEAVDWAEDLVPGITMKDTEFKATVGGGMRPRPRV